MSKGRPSSCLPRYSELRSERLPELARELVSFKVDVIVVSTESGGGGGQTRLRRSPS